MSSTIEHVAVGEVEVEVLEDPHDPARARRRPVRRHRHEVELDRQVDGPGEVAHEHERALEHADEQRRTARVVGRDLLAELGDALLELVLADDELTEVGILHASQATSLPSARVERERQPARDGAHAPPAGELGAACLAPRDRRAPARPRRSDGGGDPSQCRTARRASTGGNGASARRRGRRRRPRATPSRPGGRGTRTRPQDLGLAGQDRHEVAPGTLREEREHLVADPDAAVGRVVVHRVARAARTRARRRSPRCRTGASRAAGARSPSRRTAIPPSPPTRCPASRLRSTVSAWSSAVCPTRTARRAARRHGPARAPS